MPQTTKTHDAEISEVMTEISGDYCPGLLMFSDVEADAALSLLIEVA